MKKSYWELLRDPRWQQMRLRVMERADFACEECGDKTTTLNVHHTYYAKGRAPWEYEPESLRCLCEPCHGVTSDKLAEISRLVGLQTPEVIDEILGFVRFQAALNAGGPSAGVKVKLENGQQVIGACEACLLGGRERIQKLCDEAAAGGGSLSLDYLIGLAMADATEGR